MRGGKIKHDDSIAKIFLVGDSPTLSINRAFLGAYRNLRLEKSIQPISAE